MSREEGDSKEKRDDTSSNATLIDDVDVFVATTSQECGSDWILDSGCSYHMCAVKEQFDSYRIGDGGTIRMANGAEDNIARVRFVLCACWMVLCEH